MLPDLLSLLFPPTCPACKTTTDLHPTTHLCPTCHSHWQLCLEDRQCPACARLLPPAGKCIQCHSRGLRPLRRVIAGGPFISPLNALIHHYKFHHRFTLAPLLASALAPRIASLSPKPDCLLPVPLHWLRRFRRGYDQSALLARELSRLTTIPTLHALRRVKPTPPQTTQMSRRHRAANLRGAFQVPPRLARQIQHKHLLLIDDVMTTGSTLRAAARACLAAGAASTSAAVIATAVPHQLHRPTEDRHTRTTFAPDLDP